MLTIAGLILISNDIAWIAVGAIIALGILFVNVSRGKKSLDPLPQTKIIKHSA